MHIFTDTYTKLMTEVSKDIIIHIGFPKTATTWLQKKFFPKVENYQYFMPWVSNVEIIGVDPMDPNYNMSKWKEKDNLIISNENFLGIGRTSGFIRVGLANRLKEIFPDAKIILFIRNQIDLIASEYSWYVKKAGCTLSPEKFIRYKDGHVHNIFTYKPHHLMFDKVIDLYTNLFGKNQVYVYLYEDLKSNPKTFLKQFSDQHNLKVNTNLVDFSPINTRLRKRLVPFIRAANLFTQPKILYRHHFISLPYLGNYVPRIAEWLNKYSIWGNIPESTQVLGPLLSDELRSYYKESNQRLIDHYGLTEIKNYNYPL